MNALHDDGLRQLLARATAVALASVGAVLYLHFVVAGVTGPDPTSLLVSGLIAIAFVSAGTRTPADGSLGTALMLFAVVMVHVGAMLLAGVVLETQIVTQFSSGVLAAGALVHLGAGLGLAGTIWDVPLVERKTRQELPDAEPTPERHRGHPADD